MFNSNKSKILVNKELITFGGKQYYKLYLYSEEDGVIYQVLAPILKKEILMQNEVLESAI